jgi:hypothetical protein
LNNILQLEAGKIRTLNTLFLSPPVLPLTNTCLAKEGGCILLQKKTTTLRTASGDSQDG